MTLPFILTHALTVAEFLKYPLIGVGAFLEGPMLMVASGFLLKHHLLKLVPLFVALMVGDLLGDIMWYYVGYFFAEPLIRKNGRWFGVTLEIFEKTKNLFNKHHKNILLISKMTLGFGVAKGVLMAAGAARVPFKKFLILNTLGELFLIAVLLGLGYFFGNMYTLVSHPHKLGFLVIVIGLVIVGLFFATRKMKQKFLATK